MIYILDFIGSLILNIISFKDCKKRGKTELLMKYEIILPGFETKSNENKLKIANVIIFTLCQIKNQQKKNTIKNKTKKLELCTKYKSKLPKRFILTK